MGLAGGIAVGVALGKVVGFNAHFIMLNIFIETLFSASDCFGAVWVTRLAASAFKKEGVSEKFQNL